MNRTQISAIAIALSALIAGPAIAADNGPATRAQVKAELAEAVRTGNVIISTSGELAREAHPNNYPAPSASTVTRAQVQAELAEAHRAGNMLIDESGQTRSQARSHEYPSQQYVASKTRDEVRTELAEAAANGAFDRHIEA